jgi:hypothetical protein
MNEQERMDRGSDSGVVQPPVALPLPPRASPSSGRSGAVFFVTAGCAHLSLPSSFAADSA